jgi:hypothetical protein
MDPQQISAEIDPVINGAANVARRSCRSMRL